MRLAVFFLLAALVGPVRAEAPLSTADVVRFLRAGIGERTILTELKAVHTPREAISPPAVPGAGPHPPTFAAVTRTVRVPVSVLDKEGRPILGLKGPVFRVSENGKPQAVTLFSGERRPLRIALALDISGSMQSKIGEVQAALRRFIDLLEPADQIMVLTFNDHVQTLQDFTSDRERLGRVFDMLEPVGGTALYDAAFESIRRVASGPAESKAVVLVSDGVDTSSFVSFSQLREYARRSEVPVFSIGLGGEDLTSGLFPASVRPPHGGGRGAFPGGGGRGHPGGGGGWPGGGRGPGGMNRKGFDARPLLELADETGGRAEILKERQHYTPDSDEPQGRLKEAVETIAMTLRHRYLVGYEPAQVVKGWRTIKVEVERPNAEARARNGYYAGD